VNMSNYILFSSALVFLLLLFGHFRVFGFKLRTLVAISIIAAIGNCLVIKGFASLLSRDSIAVQALLILAIQILVPSLKYILSLCRYFVLGRY
jgi:hypothetical protein